MYEFLFQTEDGKSVSVNANTYKEAETKVSAIGIPGFTLKWWILTTVTEIQQFHILSDK